MMRLLLVLMMFVCVAGGCSLFTPGVVQLDPNDPIIAGLKGALDAGAINQADFERAIQSHVGVAVREIKDDLKATLPSVAEVVKSAVVDAAKDSPPTDKTPMGLAYWLAIVGIPAIASALGARSALKKTSATISSKDATSTRGERPVVEGVQP